MFEITPVSMTQIDWSRFVTAVNTAIGRSPTRQLDASEMPVGTPASFISALSEFQVRNSNPTHAFHSDRLLKHMSFGFLVSCDRETLHQMLIAGEDFSVLLSDPGRQKENFIITATLLIWRNAIVEACQPGTLPESREFFNQMWILFDKFGFREIFGNYRRKDLKDNTFALEHRR